MVAAFLAAGGAYAHGDAKHARKAAAPMEMKETNFGRTGDPKKVSRTVGIDMSDKMRFTTSELTVKRGETVRFVAKNDYKDPGWYKQPPGTAAYEWTGAPQPVARSRDGGAKAGKVNLTVRKSAGHKGH